MGPTGTRIVRLAFAIALAALGLLASVQGLATSSFTMPGDSPLAFAPNGTPSGQTRQASLSVAAGDYTAALAPARRSLAQRPLDAATIRLLAVAQLNTDNEEGAGRSLTLASQLGWRDGATQLLLFQVARQSGDMDGAAIRFDSLARQRLEAERLKELMHAFLLDPGAPEALAERLSANPPWRREYLLTTDPVPANAHRPWFVMLATMKRIGSPPRPNEYTAFERTLIDVGQVALAIEASRAFGALGKGRSAGFEAPAQGDVASPFEWSVFPGREASVSQPEAGAVQIASDGQTGGPVIQRVFPLSVGPHLFTVRSQRPALDAGDAFRWTVTCLPSRVQLDAAVSVVHGIANDPPSEQVAFVSPAGCIAARIVLNSVGGKIRGDYSLTLSHARLD